MLPTRTRFVAALTGAFVFFSACFAAVAGANDDVIAGTGVAGFNGHDHLHGNKALFSFPHGVALDTRGDVIVADQLNNLVRRIHHRSGAVSTIAGARGAGHADSSKAINANIFDPTAVIVAPNGDIYFTQTLVGLINKIDAKDGTIEVVAGSPSHNADRNATRASEIKLKDPSGLALDGRGNLYIADSGHNRVLKVTPEKQVQVVAAAPEAVSPSPSRQIDFPRSISGIAVCSNGDIFVTDKRNSVIWRIQAGTDRFEVVDTRENERALTGASRRSKTWDSPTQITLGEDGQLYVLDRAGVSKVDPATGTTQTIYKSNYIAGFAVSGDLIVLSNWHTHSVELMTYRDYLYNDLMLTAYREALRALITHRSKVDEIWKSYEIANREAQTADSYFDKLINYVAPGRVSEKRAVAFADFQRTKSAVDTALREELDAAKTRISSLAGLPRTTEAQRGLIELRAQMFLSAIEAAERLDAQRPAG